MSRKLTALVALSLDFSGSTQHERALAALHASRMMAREGIDYLTVYPYGLPE